MSESTPAANAYLVYVAGAREGEAYLLADAGPAEFMGVPCIQGTYCHPSSDRHWLSGRRMYIPIEKILLVTEYESADAYRAAIRGSHGDERPAGET